MQWCIDPADGSANNSGDSWAVSLSGADGRTYGTTTFTTESGGLTGKAGRYIRVVASLLKIVSVESDTSCTLDGVYTAGTGRSFVIGGPVALANSVVAKAIPGDEFKFPKSPDPHYCDEFTFTHKDGTIIIPSGHVRVIQQCENNWQQAADVTVAHSTTFALSGNSVRVTVGSAFTTGKLAYCDLGDAVDLSAFQGISLGFACSGNSTGDNAGMVRLCLCSDAAGDTVVDEFELMPKDLYYNASPNLFFDFALKVGGGNLGSAIRSVALYAMADPSTMSYYMDNIVAVKAPTDEDHICHSCAVGQGDTINDLWWPIHYFADDTTIELEGQWYGEATGAQDAYVAHCELWWNSQQWTTAGGTYGNEWVMSGGWDRDTDTQNGLTACHMAAAASNPYCFFIQQNAVKVKNFIFRQQGVEISSYRNWATIEDCCFMSGPASNSSAPLALYFNSFTSMGCIKGLRLKNVNACCVYHPIPYGGGAGLEETYKDCGSDWEFENVRAISGGGIRLLNVINSRFFNLEATNSIWGVLSDKGVTLSETAKNLDFYGLVTKDNEDCGINVEHNATNVRVWDWVSSGNAVGGCYARASRMSFFNPDIGDATEFAGLADGAYIVVAKRDKTAGLHRIIRYGGSIDSEGAVRHTASGVSWAFSPTAADGSPIGMKLGAIALQQGVETILGLWARRTSTGINGRFFVPGRQLGGIATTVEDAITANADIWELLQLTVTPTETGVVEVFFEAWGGTEHKVYIDDFSLITP